jgi:hypothetical protein
MNGVLHPLFTGRQSRRREEIKGRHELSCMDDDDRT